MRRIRLRMCCFRLDWISIIWNETGNVEKCFVLPYRRPPLPYYRLSRRIHPRHLPRHRHFYNEVSPLEYVKAFLCGGVLCIIGQVLIDKTKLTPARILVGYVTAGVILGGLGLYPKLVEWAGAGATVPLTGFGNLLAKGVKKAVAEQGLLGAFTGGSTAAAGGITAAIFFASLIALFFKSKPKR